MASARSLKNWFYGVVNLKGLATLVSIAIALAISPAVLADDLHEVHISGFQQGLMGADGSGVWHVYEPGERFRYAVNGKCQANRQQLECMWHGFEFNYTATDDFTAVNCTSRTSPPVGMVDPDQKLGDQVSVFNWVFTLKGRAGSFQNPQYSVWPEHSKLLHVDTSTNCYYAGKQILEFEFSVLAPPGQGLVPARYLSSRY